MLERDIERSIVIYSKMYDYITYKFTSPSNRSVPDRIFISPEGVVLFVEFKRAGKTPTKLQAHTINKLTNSNCNVFVIDNINDGKTLIEKYASELT